MKSFPEEENIMKIEKVNNLEKYSPSLEFSGYVTSIIIQNLLFLVNKNEEKRYYYFEIEMIRL